MPTYNEKLKDYITRNFAREDIHLRRARDQASKKGLPAMSIDAEEGRFLQFLTTTCHASNAIEIGSLGGYSGIWIARGLAPGGKLFTLEKNPHHAEVAREQFELAGLSNKVEVMVGEGKELLKKLGLRAPFDFIFIDADKSSYDTYYDWAINHTRVGSIIAAHNAFRGGNVILPDMDCDIATTDNFNRRIAYDPRVISTIYPGGDGTLVAVKIS